MKEVSSKLQLRALLTILSANLDSCSFAYHLGFSFVYLIQDTSSLRHYALKKILISSSSGMGGGGGEEALKEVMKEVEAYRRFKHPNIIKILDVAVVQSDEDGGGGKVVYL